jgi:membrane protein implicated in regulation of membrane protease activity
MSGIEPTHWFALGFAFLVAEILTGTTYLLWPAAAAALTALLALFAPADIAAQWAVFAVLTIALTVTGHFYVRGKWLKRQENTVLNERAHTLVGQIAIAASAFEAGMGRVRLGDTVWQASSAEAIADGQQVTVVGVDGSTLQVKKTA